MEVVESASAEEPLSDASGPKVTPDSEHSPGLPVAPWRCRLSCENDGAPGTGQVLDGRPGLYSVDKIFITARGVAEVRVAIVYLHELRDGLGGRTVLGCGLTSTTRCARTRRWAGGHRARSIAKARRCREDDPARRHGAQSSATPASVAGLPRAGSLRLPIGSQSRREDSRLYSNRGAKEIVPHRLARDPGGRPASDQCSPRYVRSLRSSRLLCGIVLTLLKAGYRVALDQVEGDDPVAVGHEEGVDRVPSTRCRENRIADEEPAPEVVPALDGRHQGPGGRGLGGRSADDFDAHGDCSGCGRRGAQYSGCGAWGVDPARVGGGHLHGSPPVDEKLVLRRGSLHSRMGRKCGSPRLTHPSVVATM